MPWKMMLVTPILGLLFVMFMPIVGFAVVLGALAKAASDGLMNTAAKLEKWAGPVA